MTNPVQYVKPDLFWVQVTSPDHAPYWARTSRMLAEIPEAESRPTIDFLLSGNRIAFKGDIYIQCAPITGRDKQRMEHLLTFEQGGFHLATFRQDMALFYKGVEDYFSMNEMAERGFMPSPAIAVGQWNAPINSFHGRLIDVFVPVALGPIYFMHPTAINPTLLSRP